MKLFRHLLVLKFIFITSIILTSCRKNEDPPAPTVVGEITVNLNANGELIRKREALIGNFITDALAETIRLKGNELDFCLINSGSIRFNTQKRPSGIYPAGSISNNDIIEMLPFGNVAVLVKMTGAQIKEVLERSVAQYPLAKGPFLQLSKEIRIIVDTLAAEQQLNLEETAIISPGARITSIEINGIPFAQESIYKVLVIDFIAEGKDGFLTFNSIPAPQKIVFPDHIYSYVVDYIIINTPITPVLDGRIHFQ